MSKVSDNYVSDFQVVWLMDVSSQITEQTVLPIMV